MKIYFGFTVAGDRSGIDTARKVVHLLEESGHEVLTRHLVGDNAWEADRSISPKTFTGATWLGCSSVISLLPKSPGLPSAWDSRRAIFWGRRTRE
jgi:hypothetical protein